MTKFFGDRLKGVDSVGGRKLPFPIDKASRCYHRAVGTAQSVIHTSLACSKLIDESQDVREPASCNWCSTGLGHI